MTTKTPPKLIAVPELAGSAHVGATVYWSQSGPVNGAQLLAAWEAAGLDRKVLPDLPTPRVAIGRAAHDLAGRRKLHARQLKRSRDWIIMHREPKTELVDDSVLDDLKFPVFGVVGTDTLGRPTVIQAPKNASDEEQQRLLDELRVAYNFHLDNYDTDDLRWWVTHKLLRSCCGVCLKPDEGHIYFVHAAHLETWTKMTRAISSVSAHRFFQLPTVSCDQAVEAVLFAVEEEAKAAVEKLEAQIAQHINDEKRLGKEALGNRASEAEEVETKVGRYEALLGTKLDEIRERLNTLRASITAATLEAEAAPRGREKKLEDRIADMFGG